MTNTKEKSITDLANRFLDSISSHDLWIGSENNTDALDLYGKGERLTIGELSERVAQIKQDTKVPSDDIAWGLAAREGSDIDEVVLSSMKEDREAARQKQDKDASESD